MRLEVLDHGHRRRAVVALALMRVAGRTEPDDVIKTSLYRPALFGRSWVALVREVLRGPSPWTAGERELFAAFTSRLNACAYCASVHSELAGLELGNRVTTEMLDDIDHAGFDERITAVLHLIEKSVRKSETLELADFEEVRSAGLDDDAIIDALYVSFIFNLVNRLANTLDYRWSSAEDTVKAAHVLRKVNYSLPRFLLSG